MDLAVDGEIGAGGIDGLLEIADDAEILAREPGHVFTKTGDAEEGFELEGVGVLGFVEKDGEAFGA